MNYSISHIASITGNSSSIATDTVIGQLLLDSRKIGDASLSLFFALEGPRRDGHQFIPELYNKGVRNFVVTESVHAENYPDANFIFADDALVCLQQLAAWHRSQFSYPVIGITGSNGKTIVKEWLYQLLHADYSIVRSPKSYNSQIGVPLSLWQMEEQHTLGIFEAGISQQGEMLRLERMIRPTIGILTGIGEAHSEGFNDPEHKFREKISLFKNAGVIIGREIDLEPGREVIESMNDAAKIFTWGFGENCDLRILSIDKSVQQSVIRLSYKSESFELTILFTDDASVENAMTCCATMLYLGIPASAITEGMKNLHPVNMRLELKKGINHCTIINDSYSADLSSLEIALNFLDQQNTEQRKTIILSDFLQSSLPDEELYGRISEMLQSHAVKRMTGIGPRISAYFLRTAEENPGFETSLFGSTEEYLRQFRSSQFREEVVLVKGARSFEFEKIVQVLEEKAHQTRLEINLNALAHNLNEYKKIVKPSVKIMAMVKAFAYGSGGAEIAGVLQYHKIDWLAVAYADEGAELRRAGIHLPIMVMNPESNAFETIVEFRLEPEIYSFSLLNAFDEFLRQEGITQYPVHIELETGMNRLGFSVDEMNTLADRLSATPSCHVQSVFSHLAASEEEAQADFTKTQFEKFNKASQQLVDRLGYPVIRHIANSAAVVRYPEMHLDMVRLGIGLYGVDSAASGKLDLQNVTTLRSTIAQIKKLKPGDSVSYNRRTIVDHDTTIATIRLGYADGYPRRLGNGAGKVWIKGKLAPLAGTVCMDMIMADITGIENVQEGDEVVIFGKELPIENLAGWAGTIPYEIMTGISQRVKRVYFEE